MTRYWKPLLLAASYVVLIFILFENTFIHLRSRWNDDDFSYCYLVPLVVVYLIWEKRDLLRQTPRDTDWRGLILFFLGISCFWLGELGGEFFSLFIALWFLIIGLLLLHLGWPIIKTLRFPIALSLAMFPPPNLVAFNLSLQLRLISSRIGVFLMQVMGMSAYREGNVVDLGFARLQVVDACSGLRYLFPIIILGLILAYFFKGQWWKKLLLVISAIPLVVFANGVRIAMTGFLYQFWGPMVAEGFFHDFAGWFTFIFALAVLLPEMALLKRLLPAPNADISSLPLINHNLSVVKQPSSKSFQAALIGLIVLSLTIFLSHGIEFREKIPIKQSLSLFPLTIGQWQGIRSAMDQQFFDALHFSEYAMVDYRNREGQTINFYVAYYDSQRKGESIHSPSSCLPGGGWVFNESGLINVDMEPYSHQALRINRAFIEKGAMRQLTYYWFPQRGRQLTNMFEMKFFAFWDALTKQRTDGALIRLITPVDQNESVEQADRRLQEMTRQIMPLLDRFIPGKDA